MVMDDIDFHSLMLGWSEKVGVLKPLVVVKEIMEMTKSVVNNCR
jgi:hypothetical protein